MMDLVLGLAARNPEVRDRIEAAMEPPREFLREIFAEQPIGTELLEWAEQNVPKEMP